MSAASLPAWVEVGAPALVTWGIRDEHVEKVVVTKITPTGQVVTNGGQRNERRFMARDFRPDGTAHKWSTGTFGTAYDLFPVDHEKAPLILAQQEVNQTWGRVRRDIDVLEKAKTLNDAAALVQSLSNWRRAKENLDALS
jgi:hypothetical protein